MIDFGGWVKIADFGLATSWPITQTPKIEGDRQYLASESMNDVFGKFSDIFSLGIMMAEIAGNFILPHMGDSWTELRRNFDAVLPSLTWSTESSLVRHRNGKAYTQEELEAANLVPLSSSDNSSLAAANIHATLNGLLADAPRFMIIDDDPNSIDHLVRHMIQPDPELRPTAEDVCQAYGCQWVAQRRQAGATVYEGNFGPAADVIKAFDDYPDAMDIS